MNPQCLSSLIETNPTAFSSFNDQKSSFSKEMKTTRNTQEPRALTVETVYESEFGKTPLDKKSPTEADGFGLTSTTLPKSLARFKIKKMHLPDLSFKKTSPSAIYLKTSETNPDSTKRLFTSKKNPRVFGAYSFIGTTDVLLMTGNNLTPSNNPAPKPKLKSGIGSTKKSFKAFTEEERIKKKEEAEKNQKIMEFGYFMTDQKGKETHFKDKSKKLTRENCEETIREYLQGIVKPNQQIFLEVEQIMEKNMKTLKEQKANVAKLTEQNNIGETKEEHLSKLTKNSIKSFITKNSGKETASLWLKALNSSPRSSHQHQGNFEGSINTIINMNERSHFSPGTKNPKILIKTASIDSKEDVISSPNKDHFFSESSSPLPKSTKVTMKAFPVFEQLTNFEISEAWTAQTPKKNQKISLLVRFKKTIQLCMAEMNHMHLTFKEVFSPRFL